MKIQNMMSLVFNKRYRKLFFFLLLFFSGCAILTLTNYDELFGPEVVRNRVVEEVTGEKIDYWHDVQPILDARCATCHACYDAPCQLKTTAIEGIDRGAHVLNVYNQSRILPAQPTRLFEDGKTTQEWRDRGFFPVLNEREQSSLANTQAGLLYRSLELKEQHPLPSADILDKSFTFGVNRAESCPKIEAYDSFAQNMPLWGMPYALPGLDQAEQSILKQWIEQGGTYTARAPLPAEFLDKIAHWEKLLNQESLKDQLASRYIYEHLFLAHLYFDELEEKQFFKLVRSKTPPGEPVELAVTRRPYDNPGVETVYYRIIPELETISIKSHMPYALNEERESFWRELFFDNAFEVTELPSYAPRVAANPFESFDQLPVKSRYKFMLEEAQFTIMSYIKGPVCRGSVALNVINDHFWVFFVEPDLGFSDAIDEQIRTHQDDLELPSTLGNVYVPLGPWLNYASKQRRNVQARDEFMLEQFSDDKNLLDLDLIWDGDGDNDNAALTIFRHYDSATVEKGLVGSNPKTAWVIDYALLERIHYLLVAGYDVYGNYGHSLLSRLHMDFLRMEGETAFLMLLPQESRDSERDNWYRSTNRDLLGYLRNPEFESQVQPDIDYQTDEHKAELFSLLKEHLAPVLPQDKSIDQIADKTVRDALYKLADFNGEQTDFLAEMSMVEITSDTAADSTFFTILKNNGHLNITCLFNEDDTLLPEENTLTVAKGFIGAHPNVFMKVGSENINAFVDQVISMQTEDDYRSLLNSYGVRRTNPDFWDHSDRVHAALLEQSEIEFGVLDYNRLENR